MFSQLVISYSIYVLCGLEYTPVELGYITGFRLSIDLEYLKNQPS